MAHTYPAAWHAIEEANERAWLDDWARLHLTPVPEHPAQAATVPALATTGNPR